MLTLTQESLEKQIGIQRLEEAATELYTALQASQDRGQSIICPDSYDLISVLEMAATMERLDGYRTYNAQFCKRIFDYLSIMIVAQVSAVDRTRTQVPHVVSSPSSFLMTTVELCDQKDVDDQSYSTIKAWSPTLADMLVFCCI